MGQLDAVLQSLKVTEKPARDTSLDAMSAKLDILSHAIQVIVGALSNRDKNDDFTQASIKKLAGAVQELGREVKARPDLSKSLVRIESDLKSVPREFPLPKDIVIPDSSKALTAIQSALKQIPKSFPKQKDADLKPVLEAVFRVLEKVSEPVVIPKRKDKFTFTIKRDEQDLITRIVVT